MITPVPLPLCVFPPGTPSGCGPGCVSVGSVSLHAVADFCSPPPGIFPAPAAWTENASGPAQLPHALSTCRITQKLTETFLN